MEVFGVSKQENAYKTALTDLIEYNADRLVQTERRDRVDATYLTICALLDDFNTRLNGHNGHLAVMDLLLLGPYQAHMGEVLTYLAWSSGATRLEPDAEVELMKRHERTFRIYLHRRLQPPALHLVTACDESMARAIAVDLLEGSAAHVGVEAWSGARRVFVRGAIPERPRGRVHRCLGQASRPA